MKFHALGSLTVRRDGVSVNLGGPKQRMVLAVLLLNANRVVPVANLIDAVWGEDPPTASRHTLQSYISELRKALDGRPERTGPGYLLRVAPEEFDVLRFETLAAEGRRRIEDDPSAAAQALSQALALWEGRPYDDLIGQPAVDVEVRRLEEMRLAVLEERIEADLGVGRHVELIGELEALAREHPFRERLTGQLMQALYTPDGSAIVTLGRAEGTVRVWDADTGERITELLPNRGGKSPFFNIHPDGRRVIALGFDDTVRVYTLDNDELIAIAKDRVTRSFTENECRTYLHVEDRPADS